MAFIGIIALLAAADLALKGWIEKQNEKEFPRPMKGTEGRVLLYRNHNPGFSFGVLKEHQEVVTLAPLMMASALGGILAWLLVRKGHRVQKLALSLVLGGAVSNLYDRIRRRYVVDYLCISCRRLKKVVFNLGDVFILAGSILFLSIEFFRSLRESEE